MRLSFINAFRGTVCEFTSLCFKIIDYLKDTLREKALSNKIPGLTKEVLKLKQKFPKIRVVNDNSILCDTPMYFVCKCCIFNLSTFN